MRLQVYKHYGATTVKHILKDTGAIKVLVPVHGRMNVPGTSLFAFHGDAKNVCEMWEFVWNANQKYATIIPNSFLMYPDTMKNSVYRVVQNNGNNFYVEAIGKTGRRGKPYQENTFLLVFDK